MPAALLLAHSQFFRRPGRHAEPDLVALPVRLLQLELREVFGSGEPLAEESVRAVTRICDRALVTIDDEPCQEMFCEIDRHAQKLRATGRRDLRRIGFALDAIDARLRSLQTLRSAGDVIARAAASLAKS